MVLWRISAITQYQTNDWQSAIIVFPFMLAHHWTISVICKYEIQSKSNQIKYIHHFDLFGETFVFSLFDRRRYYGFLVCLVMSHQPMTTVVTSIPLGHMELDGVLRQLHLAAFQYLL